MAAPTSSKFRIGVLLECVQLSDVTGIDILGNLSKKFVAEIIVMAPEFKDLLPKALDMEIFYISSSLEPCEVTCGMKIAPNMTYDDCPRDLDIVLIGGTMPSFRPEGADRFMKEAWSKTPVWLTVCTGSLWLASTGMLDGKKATTNRGAIPFGKQMHPDVEWVDQRWVVDEKAYDGEGKGEVWTAGGAGAGIDMIAEYALQKFDADFVRAASLVSLDFGVGNKGQFYSD